jgi:hypothetical protein
MKSDSGRGSGRRSYAHYQTRPESITVMNLPERYWAVLRSTHGTSGLYTKMIGMLATYALHPRPGTSRTPLGVCYPPMTYISGRDRVD